MEIMKKALNYQLLDQNRYLKEQLKLHEVQTSVLRKLYQMSEEEREEEVSRLEIELSRVKKKNKNLYRRLNRNR